MNAQVAASFLGCFLMFAVASTSMGQNTDRKRDDCISIINQQATATRADDFAVLKRLGQRFLNECKDESLISSDNLAEYGLGQIAVASNALGDFDDGLAAAQSCIDSYYDAFSCHLGKADALFGLGRKDEAFRALTIAEKVMNAIRQRIDQGLQTATGANRNLLESQLDLLDASQGFAERTRAAYSSN